MAGLTIERFEGGSDWMHTQYDEQIDWQRSRCTQQEFANNHDKHLPDLAWRDGADPIRIYFHYPTRSEISAAYREAGVDLKAHAKQAQAAGGDEAKLLERMTDDDLAGTLDAAVELGRLVVDRVVNLDGWPQDGAKTHEPYGRRHKRLRPGVLPEPLLEDVGMYVLTKSTTSDATGKRSASPAGGPSKQSGAATPTTATGRTGADGTPDPDRSGGAIGQ